MAKRGNPEWGKPLQRPPATATEFDTQVVRLRLTPAPFLASAELRRWCEQNRNRVDIPEWLLKVRIRIEDTSRGAAKARRVRSSLGLEDEIPIGVTVRSPFARRF